MFQILLTGPFGNSCVFLPVTHLVSCHPQPLLCSFILFNSFSALNGALTEYLVCQKQVGLTPPSPNF